MARKTRYSIYDKMEEDGVFDVNPANATARSAQGELLYKGPVAYPKMLYHPKGEQRIMVEPSLEATTRGPQLIDEQRELIHQIVATPKEAKELIAAGWHEHPSDAIAARYKVEGSKASAPAKGTADALAATTSKLAGVEAELAALKLQLANGE